MADGNINIDIALDSKKFDQEIDNMVKTTKGKLDNIGSSMQKVGTSISNAGAKMTTGITLPIIGMTAAIAKIGAEFEYEMSKVQAISGATEEDLGKLNEKAKLMGATTKFSATESAEAFKYMAMAGWDAEKMVDGLDGVMMAAAASGEDLGLVSDIITDGLTAFKLEAKDSAKFADVLATTASSANTDIAMLGETFKYAAPLAGALGISVEDVAIATGLMANSGIKASQAGTSLRSTFTRIAKPTAESAQAMEEFGISIEDITELGWAATMDKMRIAAAGMSKEQLTANAAMLAGKPGMTGLLAILNATEEDYNSLTEAIYNSEGAAKAMADTTENNLMGRLTILKSSIEGVALQLYDLLLPSFEKLVEKAQELVTSFAELDESTKIDILKGAGIAAAIGPVLLVFGKLVTVIGSVIKLLPLLQTAFTVLTGPIGLVIAVVAGLVLMFKNLWDTNEEFRTNITESWESIKESLSGSIEKLIKIFNDFWDQISDSEIFSKLEEVWLSFKDFFKETFEGIFEIVETIFTNINDFLEEHGETITDTLVEAWEFAEGIVVPIIEGISDTLDYLKDVFSEVTDLIINVLNGDWEEAWKNVENIAERTEEFLSESWENIKTIFLNTFDDIRKKASDKWEEIKKTITDKVDKIVQDVTKFFDELPYNIGYALGQAVGKIIEFGTDFKEWVDLELPIIIENVIEFFKELPSKIWEHLLEAIQKIKDWFTGMGSEVDTEMPSLVERIKDGFSNLPGNMVEIGKNIIQGMIDGIKSKVGAVGSAITDVANGIVEGAQSALDINSPSRVMADEVGEEITAGIAVGMEKGIKYITSPIDNLISTITTKIANGSKDMATKINDTLNSAFDGLIKSYDKLGDGITTALKKQYEQQEKLQLSAIDKELSNEKKLTDSKLAEYDKQYRAKLKALNEEEADLLDSIYSQIDAIDDKTEAENRAIDEKEHNEKLAEKYNQLAVADLENKAAIQKEIDDMISQWNRKQLLIRRNDEKDALRDQIQEIKNNYSQQKEEAKKAHDDKVEQLNKDYKAFEDSKKKEYEATKVHFETLRNQDQLEAEARRLILDENNQEMINLLESYNPKWLDAGKSFGEKMLEGLLGVVPSIQDTVNGIMETVSNATSFVSDSFANTVDGISSTGDKYIIKSGDTLSDIAKQFGTTVSELAKINNIGNVDLIITGDTLQLPNLSSMYDDLTVGLQDVGARMSSKFGAGTSTTNTTTNNDNGININVNYTGTGSDEEVTNIGRKLGEETQRALRSRGLSYA